MFRQIRRHPLRLLNAVFAFGILIAALLVIAIARQLTSTERDPANHIQWAAYQIQAEFLKTAVMAERVANGEFESAEVLALRFDVFVSRIGVLRGEPQRDLLTPAADEDRQLANRWRVEVAQPRVDARQRVTQVT